MENRNLRDEYLRRDTIRKDANELTDRLMKDYTLEEVLEFMCWVYDRLGNKHDIDAVGSAKLVSDSVARAFNKLPSEAYEVFDRGFTADDLMFLDLCDVLGVDPRETAATNAEELLKEHEVNDDEGDWNLWDDFDDEDFEGGE